MSAPFSRSHMGRLGELGLWTGACSVVLFAHLAAATVLLRQEPEEMGELSPPAAIMIELAPEPEAAATEETVVSEQTQDSQEVKPVQEEPVKEAEAEPEPQPPVETAQTEPTPEPEKVEPEKLEEPVQEVTKTVPEEPEPIEQPAEEQLAMLEHVEVPLPVVRPPPAEEKPEVVEKEAPKPQKTVERRKPKPQPPESKAAVQAKAEVQEATRTAAATTSTSMGGSSISPARWQSKLAAHLARQRGKCPAAGKGSTAYVTFRIDDAGNLSSVLLSRSSGYSDFDQYMVDLVRRASPVPPPPAGIGNKVTVPLGYKNC